MRKLPHPVERLDDELLDRLIKTSLKERVGNATPPTDLRRHLLAQARRADRASDLGGQVQSGAQARFDLAYYSASGRPAWHRNLTPMQRHYSYLMLALDQLFDPVKALIR